MALDIHSLVLSREGLVFQDKLSRGQGRMYHCLLWRRRRREKEPCDEVLCEVEKIVSL